MTNRRQHAIEWAVRMVSPEVHAVFMDTETSGVHKGAEIVDIAIMTRNGRVLLDTLVRPVHAIPPEATMVHGINDQLVQGAPTFEEIHPLLVEYTRGQTVVIYSSSFDTTVIRDLCQRDRLFYPISKPECALLAYADFDGTPGKYPNKPKWHKLNEAAQSFGHPPGGHRALGDTEACRQIVWSMAAMKGS